MAPTRVVKHVQRTADSAAHEDAPVASTSKSKPKHKPRSQRSNYIQGSNESQPGVQKLKAALRQTRRLLAKNNLAADVRVETVRRLKSLEADLAQAEMGRKERAMAVRYHKVKFFERKKVLRKVKQTKQQLSAARASGASTKKPEKALHELRVDLNYISHYPKTIKYISLFPPEVRHGEEADPGVDVAAKAKNDAQRTELRTWVRESMENGTMEPEPELHEGSGGDGKAKSKKYSTDHGMATSKVREGKKDIAQTKAKEVQEVEADEFFGSDSESDRDSDSGDKSDSSS